MTNIASDVAGDAATERLEVPHVVQGVVEHGGACSYTTRDLGLPLYTPAIDFDAVVRPRSVPGPAFDTPLSEIIDFLVEVSHRLDPGRNPLLSESIRRTSVTSGIPVPALERMFAIAPDVLSREALEYRVERNLGSLECLDGWVEQRDPRGRTSRVRAVPPRLIHMVAGNAPVSVVKSIADGALVKAVNLFKMPSVDPFTTVAVLRTMAEVDPGHPVVRSMSALYWRGGDTAVEDVLYRAQYFDKIVAWGGGDAIANVARYVGPGFQLVSFDPKTSIALVGGEASGSRTKLEEAAALAAADIAALNQDACSCPRFVFYEGDTDQADAFSEVVCERLRDRPATGGPRTPGYIRDAVEGLRFLEPEYRVWGSFDGGGLVVRSLDPVDFHPTAKTVNVVPVPRLLDAVRYATVATQTVGVYPFERRAEVRDALAYAGAQRVVRLGSSGVVTLGTPHDGMYPLHRFVSWVVDDDA